MRTSSLAKGHVSRPLPHTVNEGTYDFITFFPDLGLNRIVEWRGLELSRIARSALITHLESASQIAAQRRN